MDINYTVLVIKGDEAKLLEIFKLLQKENLELYLQEISVKGYSFKE